MSPESPTPSASPSPRSDAWVRLLTLGILAGGIWLAATIVAQLLEGGSRASHLVGSWHGLWLAGACVIGALCLALAIFELRGANQPVVGGLRRLLRDLFVLTVLALATHVLVSHNFKPFLLMTFFAIACGTFAGARMLDRRFPSWRSRRPIRWMELLAFQACLILVVLESSLRLIGFVAPSPIFARDDSNVDAALAMYRMPPGTLRFGFPCNSGGHYDAEFAPGERTVVSIGDSFSAGIVPHWFHFTTVCERELADLGVQVHNLGVIGIGPGGYLRLLEQEGRQLEPDLILINLFAGNDVRESARFNSPSNLVESLSNRRNVLSWQVPLRLWRLSTVQAGGALDPATEFQAKHHGIPRTSDPQRLREVLPWIDRPELEVPAMSPDQFARVESERADAIRLGEQHGDFERLFAALDQARRVAGDVPLAVMLIPDQFQIDEDVWSTVCGALRRADLDRDQPQRRIRAWLDARGIPYLDLLEELRAQPRSAGGQRHLYHLRDTHFNARGNQAVGVALARFLRTLLR